MLGVAAFPSLGYTLLSFGLPESPRWLIGRKNDARRGLEVLRLIRPQATAQELETEVAAIRMSTSQQGSAAKFCNRNLRRPILLAISIAFFNQLSGINAILYFAPRIFEMTGLGAKAELLQT
jgi:SP family arabinose:H+ symporter-like MFS transporter